MKSFSRAFGLRLEKSDFDKVKAIAEAENSCLNEVIRRAVKKYLSENSVEFESKS